jgi:hypothetical protein
MCIIAIRHLAISHPSTTKGLIQLELITAALHRLPIQGNSKRTY